MNNLVQDWLEQAKAGFKSAQDLLLTKNYYAAVSFSQQAAEKSLKAVYILLNDKLPPKIHDLVELSRLVSAPKYVFSASENLTGTYFSSRYPGAAPEIPSKFYTLEKAKIHLHEAEEVIRWSKSMIQ